MKFPFGLFAKLFGMTNTIKVVPVIDIYYTVKGRKFRKVLRYSDHAKLGEKLRKAFNSPRAIKEEYELLKLETLTLTINQFKAIRKMKKETNLNS